MIAPRLALGVLGVALVAYGQATGPPYVFAASAWIRAVSLVAGVVLAGTALWPRCRLLTGCATTLVVAFAATRAATFLITDMGRAGIAAWAMIAVLAAWGLPAMIVEAGE